MLTGGQVMGYSRYRYTFFQLNPEVRAVASKDIEETKKKIERLAKEQARQEAAELEKEQEGKVKSKKEIEAAEKKAKKEAERLAKEEAKKKAEGERRFKEAEAKAKKEAEKLDKEQAKKEAEEAKRAKKGKGEPAPDAGSATYEGNYQLVLPSSAGFKQVSLFTQRLAGREDVDVVWTGGSVDEGTLITVSVAQATPLARILSEMPMVEGVEIKGNKITVTLKT
jgi:hypothetical protein